MDYTNPHGPSCPWYPITQKQGAPNIKWCEETLCQWVSEPANTWSNLGYLTVAIVVTYLAFKDKKSSELKQFGPIVFFMGAMSFFYHQSNFYGSQILDFVGMFFFVGWILGLNLVRLEKLKKINFTTFNMLTGLILTGMVHMMYLYGIKFQSIVLIGALAIVWTEFKIRRLKVYDMKWFISALATMAVAFAFSIADGKRIWCNPENHGWFEQGHAVWHWVASLAMFMIYKHYSQEKINIS